MSTEEREKKSVDARLAAKAREQYGLIARTQALSLGLSNASIYRRLDAELWLPARVGVYRFAAVDTSWHQSLMAACLQIPGAVAYGRTAGWLYGLDGLGTTAPMPLQLAVDLGRRPRCDDIEIFRVSQLGGEWTRRSHIPVTHLPRTLIDLAGMLDEESGELALDSALRGKPGLRSWVTRVLAKYPPKAGCGPARMRKLLELRRTPSDSGLEVKLERLLRRARIPEPVYRKPVFDEDGRIGSIDYLWPDEKVVLQAHGWRWHGHRLRWNVDIDQRRRLSVNRWAIIEVTRDDLRDHSEKILQLLREALA